MSSFHIESLLLEASRTSKIANASSLGEDDSTNKHTLARDAPFPAAALVLVLALPLALLV